MVLALGLGIILLIALESGKLLIRRFTFLRAATLQG
jgi:hypothetical protein